MPEHDIQVRVTCDSDQPRVFIAAAVASAVRTILDGWTEDVTVMVTTELGEDN